MQSIHDRCRQEGGDGDHIDYAKGATVAGFNRVADAMLRAGLR
jgi:glutamate dehydrogenase/leucine dehydrogenase